jgi:hypothetical protein
MREGSERPEVFLDGEKLCNEFIDLTIYNTGGNETVTLRFLDNVQCFYQGEFRVAYLPDPPLEAPIKSKKARDKERIYELSKVISDYLDLGKPFPDEWREELSDLLFLFSDFHQANE